MEKIIPAEPGVAYPRCTGGRRDAPPEDCGGISVFNEQFADLGDLFNVGDLNERLTTRQASSWTRSTMPQRSRGVIKARL